MYVCICRRITESHVREVGRAGAISRDALISVLGLDDSRCCGRCLSDVQQLVTLAAERCDEAVFRQPAHSLPD